MSAPGGEWVRPAGAPALTRGEVHVWAVALDDDRARGEAPAAVLSAEERRRAANFRHAGRRAAFIAARAALRSILAGYVGTSAERIRLRTGPGGKPELEGPGELRFNLSHSGRLALCAVARGRDVGVDVEHVRGGFDFTRIAERFFSEPERRMLQVAAGRARCEAFFRCWTRREAYLKARGESVFGAPRIEMAVGRDGRPRLGRVAGRPDEPHRWVLCDLAPQAGYVGTLAARGDGWELRCWSWPPRES